MGMFKKSSKIVVNTIARDFSSKGESNPPRESMPDRFLQKNILPTNNFWIPGRKQESKITLLNEDTIGVFLHNNDPVVVIVQYDNWDVKWVLTDPSSSTDFLFYSAF